jgi:hypothetical protein
MAATSKAAALVFVLILAAPSVAGAEIRRPLPRTPENLTPAEAAIWPYPAPDPQSWWDEPRPKAPEAADPLGGRRLAGRERAMAIDTGVEPTVYRLWGLQPLQTQVVRHDEMILEVWTRPSRSVRQALIRIIVRSDGKAFVQARAGDGCCEAGIGRRVGFDAKLPQGAAATFLALRAHPMWDAPRDVRVMDPQASTEAVCVDGIAYDLTLVVPGRSRSLRRACDAAEIGQVADALAPALAAALGHEPRFDVLFRRGADFASAKSAYAELIAGGGTLKADPDSRAQPPGFTPAPEVEEEPAAGFAPGR